MFRVVFLVIRRPPSSTLFPYPRLSGPHDHRGGRASDSEPAADRRRGTNRRRRGRARFRSRRPEPNALSLRDRKSTRLNSSHANISYAVFCLKKKKHSAPPHTKPEGVVR